MTGDSKKPKAGDFNIKGFLVEMRNTQEKKSTNATTNFDNENQRIRNQLSPTANGGKKDFTMIIEENSPSAGAHNLNSIDEARTKGEFPANFYIA